MRREDGGKGEMHEDGPGGDEVATLSSLLPETIRLKDGELAVEQR